MKNHSVITIPYSPRWFQLKVHEELKRFNVLVFHRRAGKTVLAINELIKRIISCPLPNARGHYTAPFYSQVKRIAWKYLQDFTCIIPGMKFNQSELRAIFPNGNEIQLIGGDNYHSHRGVYSDYVVMDEFAQMHPAIWGEVFRPALSDRKGGAIFIGTPCGHNSFYKKWVDAGKLDNWYRAMYKVNETGALDVSEIKSASLEMSSEEFEQEYMCSWNAAIRGAYYGKLMEKLDSNNQLRHVPYEVEHPVITSWDLGIRDSTVIHYWQIVGSNYHLIDCDVFQGVGLPDMIKKVSDKPYIYTQHIAPHDIKVRELGTGKSRLDIADSYGLVFDVAPSLHLQDGIQAVRILLTRCYIDNSNCQDSIEALRQYKTEYDDKRQLFRNTPLHDWTSDYADSIRYFAISTHNTQSSFWNEPLDYSRNKKSLN